MKFSFFICVSLYINTKIKKLYLKITCHQLFIFTIFIFLKYGRASLISCDAVSSLQDRVYFSGIWFRYGSRMRTLRGVHTVVHEATLPRTFVRVRASQPCTCTKVRVCARVRHPPTKLDFLYVVQKIQQISELAVFT